MSLVLPETRTIQTLAFVTCSTASLLRNLSTSTTTLPMVSVTKSADMTLPYIMLFTRLFEHVRTNHPYTFSNELYLVDHVMIPLSEKRVFRFKDKGKRPRLRTPTPPDTESSDSPSLIPYRNVENDPVDNYTLDPISYMNQLPSIEGGESPEFKQTKGMFKCLFNYLCKKK
ncbi:hypothetical protein Tco_1242142 [Tanacetum coccineum]